MKLHLPSRLRAAVLACITAVAAVTTTVGTGVITTGAVAYTLAASSAQAADVTIDTNNATINTYTADDTLTFNLNGTAGGSSYLQMANITIAAHVVIDQLILNNGSSNKTYTFTNDFSGSGQFSFSGQPTNQVYEFSGDMSNYSGNMIFNDHVTLKFNGNTSGTGVITTTTKATAGAVPSLTDAETGNPATNLKINVNGATMRNSAITAGTMNVSGASSFAGVVTANSMTMAEGTVLTLNAGASLETKTALTVVAGSTLNVGNGTLLLNNALTLNGTLSLGENGKLVVGNLSAFSGITTTAPAAGENGFAEASGTIQLVNGSGTVTAQGAKKVIVSGNEFALAEDGSVAVSGIYDYGTYYLRSGQVSVAELLEETGSLLQTVQVSAGAKLVVDSGALQATIIPAADYTYSLAAGLTAVNSDRTYADVSGAGQINVTGGATLTVAGGDASDVNVSLAAASTKLHFVKGEGQESTTVAIGAINTTSTNNFTREVLVDNGVTVNAASINNAWGIKGITVEGVLNVSGELKYATGGSNVGNAPGTNAILGSGAVTAGSLTFSNAATTNTIGVNSLTITGNAAIGRNTDITAGTMTVQGNTTQSNTLTIAGGNLVLGDAETDTAALNGTVAMSSGSLTLNGATTMGTLNQTGGTLINNGTLAANGAMSIATTWDNTNGTINFGSSATITLTDMSAFEGEKSYTEGTQGFLQISSAKIIDGGTLTGYEGVTVTINGVASSLDETGSVAVSGDTDYTAYYLNEGTRVLSALTTASSGALTTVIMGEGTSLTVDSGTVQGTVSYSAEQVFSVAGGLATTLSNGMTIDGLKIDGETAADLVVANSAEVNIIGNTQGGTANFNIAANGKLNFLKGDAATATMTIGAVTNTFGNTDNYGREMNIGTGVTLTAASITNSWGMKALTVDGTLNVTGELKYSTGGNAAGTNVIGGSGSITAGSLTIANVSSINTISVNSLTVTGNASFGRPTEVTGGTTTIQGNTTVGAALTIGGGTLVLGNEATDTAALNANVTLTNGGLTLKGDTTIGNNAAIAVNGGTLQIDGNLNTHATLANGGNVVLNGTITTTSSALEAIGETGYTDELAPESGNGYLNGSFYVVKGGEGATSSLGADADVILDGTAAGHASLSASDGHVTLSVSSDTYYVNQGTVVYGATDNSAADEKTAGISLNGGNLTLSQALNEGVTINAAAAGTLTIGEGVTLAAADITRNATVTLAGEGTYAATAAADFSNLAYSGDWAGVVSLDPGAGETIALGSYPSSGTLSILSGTVDHSHNNVATLNCGLNIAAGAVYQDYGTYKWQLNLVGDLAGEGTILSKTPTVVDQGDGWRQVVISGNTADFTGEWQLENAYSGNATGNRRVAGTLNSADGIFGGVVSFVSVVDGENAPSADKAVAELRIAKSMTIGGVKGSLGTIVAETAGTELVIDVADGKDLTYSGKLDMGNIKTLTVTGDGTQTFSGITSTGAGAIVVGSDGAPVFAGANTISNLTIESGATLANSGSITITGNLTLNETLDTDTTLALGEGATIVVTDSTAFEQSAPTKRVDALGRETAATGNGFDADGGITLVKGTAATGVNGSASIDGTTYTVTDGVVDMATFTNYFVTSTDADITAENVAAYAAEKGAMLSSITVSNGAEFAVNAETMNVRTTDGGGTLTVTDSLYNLELGADTQVDNTAALYTVAVTGGESTISGEGTVGAVTVNGGKLTVEDVGTGAVEVTDGSATIGGDATTLTVSGGSLTVEGNSGAVTATGGSTTVLGTIGGNVTTNGEGTQVNVGGSVSGSITTSNGVVKFAASETNHEVHLLDLSKGDTALGHVEIESGATVAQVDNNLWMRAGNAGVLLEEGGTMITNQGHVTVTGLEGGGSITISEDQNYYQTGVDKFVFTNVAVSTANEGETSLATQLSGAEVENLGTGMLTVISDGEGSITSVAATNGNVTVNGRTAETAIALDAVTLGAGKSLTLGGDATIGALNVDLATYVTEVPTEALTLISTAAGKTLTFDTLDTSAKSVTIGEKTYVAQLALNDNTLTLAYTEASDLYWNGGNGNFSDEAWAVEGGSEAGELPFIAGMGVTFDGTGGEIVVDSAVSVSSMLVSGAYSFTSAGNLTITGTLTVDGTDATIDALPTVDAIVVNAESSLSLAAAQLRNSAETLLSKATGEGMVQLSSGTGFGTDNNRISISDRTVTAATNLDISNDIAVNGWKSSEQTGVTGSLVLTKETTVGGEIRMEMGAKLVMGEGASLTADKLSLGHASESAMAVGHLEMTGGDLTVGSIGLNNNQANTMTVTGGNITITGANAFTGEGAATTVSLSGASLTTDGEHSWALNHSATLTDMTIDAAEGTTITIGGSGLTTTINGTLTNKGAMALGSDLSMGALTNEGSIDLGSYALTLTEAIEQGGTIEGTGSLTLAAGANAFTAVTGSSVDLTTTGATLSVSDALSMGNITLGALTNTVQAGSLTDTLGLTIGADALSSGTHSVVTLGTAFEGSATLTVGEQTFNLGDEAAQLTESNKMVQLVMNEAGTAMNIIVSYAGGVWEGGEPGDESAEWSEETVPGDTVTFDGEHGAPEVAINSNVEMETIVVNGEAGAKEYTFTGDGSVTTETLDMSGNGSLTVKTEMGAGEASLADNASLTVGADGSVNLGTLTMDTDGSVTVDESGSLTIGSIADSGSTKDVTIVNNGTLTVTGTAAIDSLTGEGSLVITEDGTVTLSDSATLADVAGAGALVVDGDLTADSVSGNAVTADSVTLNSVGNEISTLTTDTLVVTTVEGIGAASATATHANAYVEADEVQAKTEGNKIIIELTDIAVGQVNADMGSYAKRDYLIIDSEQDMTDTFELKKTQQQDFLKGGIKTELVLGSLHLDAQKLTAAEKSWTIGADETEGGLEITKTGADAYSELDTDGVQNVLVATDSTLSLTGAPESAVLKNLTSKDGATLTVVGDAGDTVTIKSTAAAADYDKPGAHDGGLVVDGLTAVADNEVAGKTTQLASLELKNGATATTTTGSAWSVGKLDATDANAGTIEGAFTVTGKGGSYLGSYSEDGAAVTVAAGAEQTMLGGENLSLAGKGAVTLVGDATHHVAAASSITMSGGTLSIGDAALAATGTLAGGTLKADITVSDILDGTPRTLTLDGYSMNLSGTTIVLTQTDVVPGTMTVDPTSDLVIAVLGDNTLTSAATKVELVSPTLTKYFSGASVKDGQIMANRNTSYFSDMLPTDDSNAAAGLAMLDEALVTINPQATAQDGALAGIMNSLESHTAGDAEKLAAGVAGAGLASVSMALSGDVDRQLRAIRNRTTTMGVDQCVVNEDMPYINAWMNAEGDFRKMDSDGNKAGYDLSSWGGTVGFDIDCTPRFTCGMAFTAMYGDFKSKDVDSVSGDLNTYYVSAFARYANRRFTHTAVATFGLSDLSLDRTVAGADTKGDTDGTSFGAMYELGYVMALNEDASTCLQPIVNVSFRHVNVSGYTESGSDNALKVGSMTADTVTVGAGARLQSIVGENIYNRSSIFEARALVKVDAGDTAGEAKTSFASFAGSSRTVKSADMGKVGVELGAGLTIPVGQESGSIFVDGSAELRSGYTDFNATIGYRVNF